MSHDEMIQLEQIPDGLLEAAPDELYRILPRPTLLHLAGEREAPLFISVLLHGNEPTGLLAVQQLLEKYQSHTLPRAVSIFFGNVQAARYGRRQLDSQPDFNRIWPGTELPDCAETGMTRCVLQEMLKRQPFASIDIHNNTGLNPHYACVNVLDHRFLHLANFFSRLVVYFIRPRGVLSAAFAPHCPAVTLECGKPGQVHGVQHALDYLDTCLHLPGLSTEPVSGSHVDLFHTVAQVCVEEQIRFSFSSENADLCLNDDIDHMNFTEVSAGTVIGRVKSGERMPLQARSEHGEIITDEYFSIEAGDLLLKKPVMPSMFTLDENIIRQDCLCYIMERIHL